MTARPTPERVISTTLGGYITEWHGPTADDVLDDLKAAGYLIVHPDDVPHGQTAVTDVLPAEAATERIIGWEACRTLIFGDTP